MTANIQKAWEEDDALPSFQQEGPWMAYARLAGYGLEDTEAGARELTIRRRLRQEDRGDEYWDFMSDGWVVVTSYPGNSRVYKPLVPQNLHDVNNDYTFGMVNTFRVKGNPEIVTCVPLFLRYGRIEKTLDDDWMIVALDLANGELRCIPLSHIEPR